MRLWFRGWRGMVVMREDHQLIVNLGQVWADFETPKWQWASRYVGLELWDPSMRPSILMLQDLFTDMLHYIPQQKHFTLSSGFKPLYSFTLMKKMMPGTLVENVSAYVYKNQLAIITRHKNFNSAYVDSWPQSKRCSQRAANSYFNLFSNLKTMRSVFCDLWDSILVCQKWMAVWTTEGTFYPSSCQRAKWMAVTCLLPVNCSRFQLSLTLLHMVRMGNLLSIQNLGSKPMVLLTWGTRHLNFIICGVSYQHHSLLASPVTRCLWSNISTITFLIPAPLPQPHPSWMFSAKNIFWGGC